MVEENVSKKSPRKSFRRQDWFRYPRLGEGWRRPRGRHSKIRQGRKSRPPVANIGYGKDSSLKGLKNGYKPVRVFNPADIEKLSKDRNEAAVIAAGIGANKILEIAKASEKKGIIILNKKPVLRAQRILRKIEKKRTERKANDIEKTEKGQEKKDSHAEKMESKHNHKSVKHADKFASEKKE